MKRFVYGAISGVAVVLLAGGIGGYVWLSSTGKIEKRSDTIFAKVVRTETRADVETHSKIFEQRIEEVIPGVHLAVGYGLANVIVIEASEGLIMVDTLESIRAAEGLLPWIDELRTKTGKQITDIIYTHNHADHVFGTGVFLRGQQAIPRIWAHEETEHRVHEVVSVLSTVTFQRAMRMFGVYLPDENFANNGIGPRLLNDEQDGFHFLSPTNVVQEKAEVTIAGERVILRHASGETADQLAVFLPERSVLLPADNYYHAFPNLYTVRGTPYRDPRKWAASIDVMRAFKAEVMIPQHSQPVLGAEEIEKRLKDYRDAIQFVYDETIRMINAGLTPTEIAEQIELPPHLANAPYLQEMYGRVEFAAKAVFSGTLGWFSGDPADLRPVSKSREAELIARLAGGQKALIDEVEKAMADGEPAWALTVATHLSRLGNDKGPALRAAALRALAEGETASSVRNYYLTSAAEAEGFEMPKAGFGATPDEVVNGIPIRNFLNSLTVNLKDDELRDREIAYGLDFSDAPPVSIRIRRGVAFLEDGLAADRIGSLQASTNVFRGIAIKRQDPAKLLLSGEMSVEGSILDLNGFLGHFQPPI